MGRKAHFLAHFCSHQARCCPIRGNDTAKNSSRALYGAEGLYNKLTRCRSQQGGSEAARGFSTLESGGSTVVGQSMSGSDIGHAAGQRIRLPRRPVSGLRLATTATGPGVLPASGLTAITWTKSLPEILRRLPALRAELSVAVAVLSIALTATASASAAAI